MVDFDDVMRAMHYVPRDQRGFDSPGMWLHPGGEDEVPLLEIVRMLMVNVSSVSGFCAAQLEAGVVVEDERDVDGIARVCNELTAALVVLRRAVDALRREVVNETDN